MAVTACEEQSVAEALSTKGDATVALVPGVSTVIP
jgi:hypothetical protein